MGKPDGIPAPAVQRLSLYLRQLEAFRESNLQTVSSKQLGQALRITDAQVRKDLGYFGQFGQPGIGYDVPDLIGRLRSILGTDRTWRVVLIGAGNLGRALVIYRGFEKKGFEIAGVFDNDPAKLGHAAAPSSALTVEDIATLPRFVEQHGIRLGVLAVPATVGQELADLMINAGITGILNFAPIALHVPAGVTVANVDLAVHLEQLSFRATGADPRRDSR